MAQPVEDWVKEYAKPFLKHKTEDQDYKLFMRDEMRPIIKNPSVFLSAADGIVLYNKILESPREELHIKGMPYTVNEIVGGEGILPEGPLLVCGVFMTYADIHINRIPYRGVLQYKMIDPILTVNMSMDLMEIDIFGDSISKNAFKRIPKSNDYVRYNSRMRNQIYLPHLDYSYYLMQIGDYEVNIILHFQQQQNQLAEQGTRFSFVRWGSQCDLILPLRHDIDIKPLIPRMMHVKGGVDAVIKFEPTEIPLL